MGKTHHKDRDMAWNHAGSYNPNKGYQGLSCLGRSKGGLLLTGGEWCPGTFSPEGCERTYFCYFQAPYLCDPVIAVLGALTTQFFLPRQEAPPRGPHCPWSQSQCCYCDLKAQEASCPGDCISWACPRHYDFVTPICFPLNFNQRLNPELCFDCWCLNSPLCGFGVRQSGLSL